MDPSRTLLQEWIANDKVADPDATSYPMWV